MKTSILFLLIAFSLASCKSKKKAANSNNANKSEQKVDADSLFMVFEKSPCYGRCQTFKVTVYKSGYAEYSGYRNVDNIGNYTGRIKKSFLKDILNRANEIGFFKYKNEYDNKAVTDLPTKTLMINNGTHKQVKNRYGAPKELYLLEKMIDSILKQTTWVKVSDNNK